MQKMNKVLPGHKFVGNFLDEPVSVGTIYKMDDRQFIPALIFNDIYPEIDLKKWTNSGSKGDMKFDVASDVSFDFGGNATSNVGKSEVEIGFKKKKTVAGYLKELFIESLRFENVREELKDIWTKKGYDKFLMDYIFVYEVATAASGTLIYTESAGTKVVLEHKMGEAVSKLSCLGSGNFEMTVNSRKTIEIIRNTAHKPLFKAFRFRKNWEPEILG